MLGYDGFHLYEQLFSNFALDTFGLDYYNIVELDLLLFYQRKEY